MNIVYVSSEKFMNDFIDAIRKESNMQFRNTYRSVDMLLIDDIQFLAGKEGTQEEFFHTFNELHNAGKQIILTSDKPPRDIPDLEERLRSRFEWGLSCDVAPPNFETRVAILRKKAEEEGMNIPNENEIFEYIAQNVSSNIRELEGVLLKFKVLYELNGGNITEDDLKSMLNDIVPQADKKITADAIISAVAKHYGVSHADVLSSKRTSNVAKARQVGMYLARELTDLSQTGIGESFGGRDHSTVIHACTKIRSQAESDSMFSKELNQIINDIKNSNY
jgi:chromosomal replication initiator protein